MDFEGTITNEVLRVYTIDVGRRTSHKPVDCKTSRFARYVRMSQKSLNHILMQCSFARTVWCKVSQELRWTVACPGMDSILVEWWQHAHEAASTGRQKELNALINLEGEEQQNLRQGAGKRS